VNGALQTDSGTIVAAGVGNTTLQFGLIEFGHSRLPIPRKHYVVPILDGRPQFDSALPDDYRRWVVASVNPPADQRLRQWTEECGAESFHVLSNHQFPIECHVARRDQVGADRLAAAVAANRLRHPNKPVVFVDAGTALTVNAVSVDGVFLGGAILPGAGTSLSALESATQQLPRVELDLQQTGEAPHPIGNNTQDAIRSGVYWGLVGATHQLIARMTETLGSQPQVFITGGFGPWLCAELNGRTGGVEMEKAQFVPHLLLSGVALTAASLDS
jgi:type III pantothenate kinase